MGERLAHIIEEVQPHTIWQIGPVAISSTVVNTWAAMAVLAVLLWLLSRRLQYLPRGLQNVLEMAVEFIWGLSEPFMGRKGRQYAYVAGTFFILILFLNFSWFIPGVIPPTSDLSTTAALAVSSILLVQLISIRARGWRGYVGHFFRPFAPMVIMNAMELITRPFSLALRLFGNMFAEELVVAAFFALIPLLVPTPIMMLGLIFGFVQAFVFTMLSISYIAEAVSSGEE